MQLHVILILSIIQILNIKKSYKRRGDKIMPSKLHNKSKQIYEKLLKTIHGNE